MGNTYFWDLGFDFNAVQNPPGTCYLQNGFVLIQQGTNNQPNDVPGTPVDLNPGDSINFNAFNVTNPLLTGTYSIQSGSITFTSAVTNQTAVSPFNNPNGTPMTPIPFTALSGPTGTGPSVICSGIQAPEAQAPDPATFPVYAGPTGLTVQNDGRFLMTITLTVQGPTNNAGGTTTLTFVVDPEMIVGGPG